MWWVVEKMIEQKTNVNKFVYYSSLEQNGFSRTKALVFQETKLKNYAELQRCSDTMLKQMNFSFLT